MLKGQRRSKHGIYVPRYQQTTNHTFILKQEVFSEQAKLTLVLGLDV